MITLPVITLIGTRCNIKKVLHLHSDMILHTYTTYFMFCRILDVLVYKNLLALTTEVKYHVVNMMFHSFLANSQISNSKIVLDICTLVSIYACSKKFPFVSQILKSIWKLQVSVLRNEIKKIEMLTICYPPRHLPKRHWQVKTSKNVKNVKTSKRHCQVWWLRLSLALCYRLG
jgi:hypothetical protein